MAPRRRRVAAGAAAPAAEDPDNGFQQLPDGVLVRILSKLTMRDRLRAALVSRRWHQCTRAPELCRRVDLRRSNSLECSTALASLAAWMLQHGQHVRNWQVVDYSKDVSTAEVQAQLACCLMACASGQLATLRVSVAPLVVAAWAPALHSLRQLHLGSGFDDLLISSSLHSLGQLTLLVLEGAPVHFAPAACLPASIKQLSLADSESDALPAQLEGLSNLAALTLRSGQCSPDGFSGLTRLSALTRLQLFYTYQLPTCLGRLTGLQALVCVSVMGGVLDNEAQASAALNAALSPLTQLTSLQLEGMPAHGGLPALAGLASLQRACFRDCRGLDSLPAGPWCRSLQAVGVDWECLQRSQAFSAAAERLQHVVVLGGGQQAGPALTQWAARHPPLRRLQLLLSGQVPAALIGHVLRLKEARPQLALTHENLSMGSFNFTSSFQLRMECR